METLYDRVRALLAEKGLTDRAGSMKAGLGPNGIREIKREHTPTAARLEQLATFLGVSTEYLLHGRTAPPSLGNGGDLARPAALPVMTAHPVELPLPHALRRDVPVYGVAAGNGDPTSGDFQLEAGSVIDYVARPPGIVNSRDAYALFVTGDSMEPKFEHGDLVYIGPNKPARPNDHVIICLRGRNPGDPERCFIKRLVRRHPDRVEVRQYNPDKTLTFPLAAIVRMHKVLTIPDLFGQI